MASDTKPTVLFVHGNWHSPAHFAPICDLFNKAGYPTSCPRLASCDANPSVGPYEDAASLLPELVKLVEAQERDVIVVAHSYGGVVATQAVTKQYTKNVRGMQGKRGGILRIVYLCALLPVEGETVMSQFGVGPSDPIPPHILLDVGCSQFSIEA
jgi:pimeloyl-ACP methyl ester carboxylesterase